ncbi:Alpha-tubulin N-acetyltransferase [Diplonema papillatum]|nr:Alpha-tubulin N-acetyltransferase [Diplonema papillatum]
MEASSVEARKILQVGSKTVHVSRWDAGAVAQARRTPGGASVCDLIDAMGTRSAKAQGLPRAITSASLLSASDHALYLIGDSGAVYGLLKVGVKKLFIRSVTGYEEMTPLCVLDFYVCESHQRTGVGKKLFEHMLRDQGRPPRKLAYDRPSAKLLSFLRKHYRLSDYTPQNNNFVVYHRYFSSEPDLPLGGPEPSVEDESCSAGDAAEESIDTTPRTEERQPAPVFKQASPAVLTARPMNMGSPLTGLSNIPPAVRTGKRLVRPSWA